MTKRDYYEILGVSKDASLEQIKKSYRQLALKYHPDRNPGNKASEEKFKEATEAYQILSDEETRSKYDRFGHAGVSGGPGGAGFADFSSFADEIFGDLFSAFFGGTAARSASRGHMGRDLRYHLEITLEEAAVGVEKKVQVTKPVPCKPCSSRGTRDGAAPEKCRQCGGAGQVRMQQGFFTIARTCPVCRGEGTVILDPCPSCGGTGQSTDEAELVVKVPAGIDHGQRLKLRGEGEIISDGPPGDLYVEVSIRPHEFFRRRDTEIICEVPITYSQAVLGGEIEVPTLYGPISMKIPPGSPSGKAFRLRSKGIVDMHTGKHGDQHVRTYVYVPENISERQRELLQELALIEGKPVANEGRSFFEKVKEFFE